MGYSKSQWVGKHFGSGDKASWTSDHNRSTQNINLRIESNVVTEQRAADSNTVVVQRYPAPTAAVRLELC